MTYTASSAAINDRHLLRFFFIQSVVFCTEFSVASIHLHQSSNVNIRFVTARATSPCAVVLLIFFSVLRTEERERVLNDLKANGYLGSLLRKCLNNTTKPRPSKERSLGFAILPY